MFYGNITGDKIYSRGQFGGCIHRMLNATGASNELIRAYRKAAYHTIIRALWLRGMSLPPPATTLDIGCGEGSFCSCVAQGLPGELRDYGKLGDFDAERQWGFGLGFTGVPHEGCQGVEVEERYSGINLDVGIKQITGNLPGCLNSLAGDCFDQVIAGDIIEHIEEPEWSTFVLQMFRIARFQVLITTPDWNSDDPSGFREPDPEGRRKEYGHEAHMYVPSEAEWTRFFTSGFIAVKTEAYRIPGALVSRIIKRPIPGLAGEFNG